ncbi:MAG: AI-2E family transporter [Patescibacteria group bacterium]
MKATPVERIFFYVLLALSLIGVIAIFFPFLSVMILAASFAVVLNPVYMWIKQHVTHGISWLASILTVILFIIVVCVPLFFMGMLVFDQVQNAYDSIIRMSSGTHSIQEVNTSINRLLPKGVTFDIGSKIGDLVSVVSRNVTGFVTSTFKMIIMFMLMVLTMFYLLKDGTHWKRGFILLCPLSEETIEEIFLKLKLAINQIIKGSFFIAIVQGLLAGAGFFIFGVPNAALWAVAAGMASFIPTIGTSIVSIPAILFLFATGMQVDALGLLVWSVALVGMIDNLLAPYVISKDTDMPSLFILFAILGGVALMGPVGILIGPLVLSLLYSLIAIYRKEAHLGATPQETSPQ